MGRLVCAASMQAPDDLDLGEVRGWRGGKSDALVMVVVAVVSSKDHRGRELKAFLWAGGCDRQSPDASRQQKESPRARGDGGWRSGDSTPGGLAARWGAQPGCGLERAQLEGQPLCH